MTSRLTGRPIPPTNRTSPSNARPRLPGCHPRKGSMSITGGPANSAELPLAFPERRSQLTTFATPIEPSSASFCPPPAALSAREWGPAVPTD
jgi:hypothetical protein